MELLSEETVACPYCGEHIDVLIDAEEAGQNYIEDCQVCCRPIVFVVAASADGSLAVSVHSEDEAV